MNPTRNGKIARLPKTVRHQLNRRLEDGEPGKRLVAWLNGLPEVQQVLQGQFGGRAISEQNLSEWKQGGYQDWLRHQEACTRVRHLTEQAEDLEAEAEDVVVSDRCAPMLAVELARVAEALLEESADPAERWRLLQEVLRELAQLRRDDHRAARLRLDQERWDRETEDLDRQEWKQEIQEAKQRACAPFWAALEMEPLAELFGNGEKGREIAALITEINHELKPGTLSGRRGSPPEAAKPIQPDPTGSNPIQPDQASPLASGAGPASNAGAR